MGRGSTCRTACWTMRSMTVGMPVSARPRWAWGCSLLTPRWRYVPPSSCSLIVPGPVFTHCLSEATLMPSTPAAPLLAITRWLTASRLAVFDTLSNSLSSQSSCPFPAKGRELWPLLTPCLRAFARHPFRPWQGLTEYEYATSLPRRLYLPYGFLMMYRISALEAASSVHLASYAVPVRAVGIFPRTSSPTVRCLPAVASGAPHAPSPYGQKLRFWLICLTAVGSFVLQVCVSASSRHLVDFHHSSRIASVAPNKKAVLRPPFVCSMGDSNPHGSLH